MTIPFCKGLPYNTTLFPNMFKHTTQEEAARELKQFWPLMKICCSDDLKYFLCSAYAPICTVLATPVPPCRHLCNSAKHGCEALTKRVDFTWPESFNCDRFPELGEEICVGDNKSDSEARDCSKKTEDFNEPLV
ncbi:protein mom-5-like isoform X2 [Oculina patagonica]